MLIKLSLDEDITMYVGPCTAVLIGSTAITLNDRLGRISMIRFASIRCRCPAAHFAGSKYSSPASSDTFWTVLISFGSSQSVWLHAV